MWDPSLLHPTVSCNNRMPPLCDLPGMASHNPLLPYGSAARHWWLGRGSDCLGRTYPLQTTALCFAPWRGVANEKHNVALVEAHGQRNPSCMCMHILYHYISCVVTHQAIKTSIQGFNLRCKSLSRDIGSTNLRSSQRAHGLIQSPNVSSA